MHFNCHLHPRLCAVVHVLFNTLTHFLREHEATEELQIPDEVDDNAATTVLQLVQYFTQQRVIINKV